MCMICHYEHDHSEYGNNTTSQNYGSNGPSDTTLQEMLGALNGSSWPSNGQTTNVTFSFDGPWGAGGTGSYGGQISQLSAHNQDQVRDMLDIYASVANVNFTETNNGTDADMAIRMSDLSFTSIGGYATLPTSYGSGGDVTLDLEFGDFNPGSIGYYAAIHELGHAMGMYHPFAGGNPNAAKQGGIPGYELNADYTVMSYADGQNIDRDEVTGLALFDIAVLQNKYGKNYDHNSGDTVYEFGYQQEARAIWDGGGNDTFKVADNVTQGAIINLNDGDFLNKIGDAEIRIAYDAEIENARGGQGNDNIRGNELDNFLYGEEGGDIVHGDAGDDVVIGGVDVLDANDGDDVLLGGKGQDIVIGNGGDDIIVGGDGYTDADDDNDVLFGGVGNDQIYGNAGDDELIGGSGVDSLYGGLGDDTYVIGSGNVLDLIYGFEGAGQAGGDMIRIFNNVNNSGIDDFDSLMQNASDDGQNTMFDLGDGHAMLVADHVVSDFSEEDFDFS